MKTINLRQELKFIHNEKMKTSDRESVAFELLNIAGVLLSNYAVAENTTKKDFYSTVYSMTKDFYSGKSH